MKNARAYLFSMAFPRVGVAARPLLATGWPIVATRAPVRRPGTRTPCHGGMAPMSRRDRVPVWTHRDASAKLEDTAGVIGAAPHADPAMPAPKETSPCTGGKTMGDKANAHPGAAGRATAADHPASVRNVVLVGHSGSGKTTLVEALALTAGAVNRAGRVEDGTAVSDYDEIEHRQQRSVQLSLVPVDWDGYKINIIDTPDTPTSSGNSGPVCAPRTRPFSSSRPRTGWTARPGWCGRSARRSACRAPS